MTLPSPQRGETRGTQNVLVEGGLFLDKDVIYQAMQLPGSARTLINFESSLEGGYHRILGYTKFDSTVVPGTGRVNGVIVNYYDDSVIAMRAGDTYRGVGAGWTKISGADTHVGYGTINFTFYAWGSSRVTFVDGAPLAHPVRIENTGTYTVLSAAPTGQKYTKEYLRHLFMSSGDGYLTFSAPGDDTDYNAINGAGIINVGFPIKGLAVWRGGLYIFGTTQISVLTGTSSEDWVIVPLTTDLGLFGENSLQEINGDWVFLSSDGIRTLSGTSRISDREFGVISRPINPIIINQPADSLVSVVVKNKSQYRLFRSTSTTDSATAAGIIGTLKQQSSGATAWEWSSLQGIKLSSAHSGKYQSAEIVVHGGWDGYIYKQESGTTFDGTAIAATYGTPYLVYGDPNLRKVLYKVSINLRVAGPTNIVLGTTLDYADVTLPQPLDQVISLVGGNFVYDSTPASLYDDPAVVYDVLLYGRNTVNLIGSCKSASFTFSSNGGSDYSIQAYTVEYGEGTRR